MECEPRAITLLDYTVAAAAVLAAVAPGIIPEGCAHIVGKILWDAESIFMGESGGLVVKCCVRRGWLYLRGASEKLTKIFGLLISNLPREQSLLIVRT